MITSRKDLERQLGESCEPALVKLVIDLFEQLGKDFFLVEVVAGGQGSPYEVVVSPGFAPEDDSGKAQVERAQMIYQNATSLHERKSALKSLAELNGTYCRIFVNGNGDSLTSSLSELTSALIKCCELCGQNPDTHVTSAV